MVTRVFALGWSVAMIVPAILFSQSKGSILQTLSEVGSYFVGAQLSMFALGFFSRHTSERGLLVGVAAGFVVVWLVSARTDIAWPWYCAIGAAVNLSVSLMASLMIDGPQREYSPYTIRGQRDQFEREGRPRKVGGWYVVPGGMDRISYLLLVYFAITVLVLYLFDDLI